MSRGLAGSTWLEALDAAIDARVHALPGRALSAASASLSARYRGEESPEHGARTPRSPHGPAPTLERGRPAVTTSSSSAPRPKGASLTREQARPSSSHAPRREAAVGAAGATMSEVERIAYLAVRAPATGASVRAVLHEMQLRGVGAIVPNAAVDGAVVAGGAQSSHPLCDSSLPDGESGIVSHVPYDSSLPNGQRGTRVGWARSAPVRTLLDLGAGPGVGVWAALDRFDTLEAATLIERDGGSVALGQALARDAGLDARLAMTWRRADLREPLESLDLAPHDLVLLSYSIGELEEVSALALLESAWRLARQALVIVEPGTPRHFARLLALRRRLIERGAQIVAPCPHARACPMAAPDWCHFAARLGRTRLHRQLKGGALSYEDEKFSYVAAARHAATPFASTSASASASASACASASASVSVSASASAPARIVRRPEFHKGFVRLPLCATDGLRVETVTKSQRERYRAARDASWGDAWEDTCPSPDEA